MVERLAIPVMTTPDAKGIFPESHPLSLRNYGLCGCAWPPLYMGSPTEPDHYDALLVLGSSPGELSTSVVASDLYSHTLNPSGPFTEADPAARASTQASAHPAALMRVINDGVRNGQIFIDAGNCVGWSLNNLIIDPPVRYQSALAMVSQGMAQLLPPAKDWTDYYQLGNPDLALLARGLGARATQVSHGQGPDTVAKALANALACAAATSQPQVIVVDIDTRAAPPYGWPRLTPATCPAPSGSV